MRLPPVFFILAVFNAFSTAASAADDLCAKKKAQYGVNFVSCRDVDWGAMPISADYHPSNFGPMTAPPSIPRVTGPKEQPKEVRYENDYPGIVNTKYYFETSFYEGHPELKGLPLASKFLHAVSQNDPALSQDQKFVQWTMDWSRSLQPTPDQGWEGKCKIWAAWSVDPVLQQSFSKIQHGLLCNGVPFSKGELKEIVTSLYQHSGGQTISSENFYKGYGEVPDSIDDANVALSKLGMLGRGDLSPQDILSVAQNAQQGGKRITLDHDPGREVWNQPLRRVTDVSYQDPKANLWEALSSAEFVNGNAAGGSSFLQELKTLESDFTQNLLRGDGVSADRLCSLRKQVGESCNDLSGTVTMSAQADILNRLKKSAFEKKLIGVSQKMVVVKHELIMEYGTEIPFASNQPDQTVTQNYSYTSLHSNTTEGAVIRAQWSPPVANLNRICADSGVLSGRKVDSLNRTVDRDQKCVDGKPRDASQGGREFFVGPVAPQALKIFTPRPGFLPEQTEQQRAYNKLLEFLGTCESFDGAVDFLKHLDQAVLDNVISAEEAAALQKEYSSVKKMLDPSHLQSLLRDKYQGVQGVALLRFD